MNYRLYQEMASVHIATLEREAHDARLAGLARREAGHGKINLSNVTGWAPRLMAQLRRHQKSHVLRVRPSTDLLLMSSSFDPVADHSNRTCEELGGANHAAGSLGRSTRDDSTLCFEESHAS
jgi:hypothetical protein